MIFSLFGKMDKESRLDYREVVCVVGETYCMAQNI